MYSQENYEQVPLTIDDSRNEVWIESRYILYGVTLEKKMSDIRNYYCPSAKIFKSDSEKSGVANLGIAGAGKVTYTSYYQRGAPQNAPKNITTDGNPALISDYEIRTDSDPNYTTNHWEGVNTLYLDSHAIYVEIPSREDQWRSDYFTAGGDQVDASGNITKRGTWTQLDFGKTERINP
jgi:hypothetical protein